MKRYLHNRYAQLLLGIVGVTVVVVGVQFSSANSTDQEQVAIPTLHPNMVPGGGGGDGGLPEEVADALRTAVVLVGEVPAPPPDMPVVGPSPLPGISPQEQHIGEVSEDGEPVQRSLPPPTDVALAPAHAGMTTASQTGVEELSVPAPTPTPLAIATVAVPGADVYVYVDPRQHARPISPLIYGLSGATERGFEEIRPALNSWGGNPSSRYNWELGNAWNTGRDWYYLNTNYGNAVGRVSDQFIAESMQYGSAVRLAVPTLGWVAKNSDEGTCSFPLPNGECGDADQASCENPGAIADPTRANVPSDVNFIRRWLVDLASKGFEIRFVAMDNEPELWGATHYDVHPACTTYEEILTKYLEYATMVREVMPESELLGPVTCCWYFYWNSAAGVIDKLKHGNQEFLPWFLEQVRSHDEQRGVRSIDVLDIHYYPEGLFNDKADPDTAAHRLRSTRSLWDRSYVDESWINEPIYLIPRMHALIARHYPGLKLGISEWNWGADTTLNGALAIADVLGIFGREGLYLASYWRQPADDSPGFMAFRMYTNYDGAGARFGDVSVLATSSASDEVTAYASVDRASGQMKVMLINKNPERELSLGLDVVNFGGERPAMLYQYSGADLTRIVPTDATLRPGTPLVLPPSSITLVVIAPL
jgi:hypothetical protein